MQGSPIVEMSRLHLIFDLNAVLVAKQIVESCVQMPTNLSLVLRPRLKDYLTKFLAQFEVYI
jgi:hypothetical protein